MGALDGQPIQARGHTFWPCLGTTTWNISGSLGAPVRVSSFFHMLFLVSGPLTTMEFRHPTPGGPYQACPTLPHASHIDGLHLRTGSDTN